MRIMKLGIGCAQFGMQYGIANRHGVPSFEEGVNILKLAHNAGIKTLDTAVAYGASEAVLGQLVREVPAPWEITTKIACSGIRSDWDRALSESEQRLGASPHTLMCHRVGDWLQNAPFRDWLFHCRTEGKVVKVGVSVYTPAEAALAARFSPDVVQAPLSILDQRILKTGVARELGEAGVELHVRSVFLQGVLFLTDEQLNPWLAPLRPILATARALAREHGLSLGLFSLAFVNSLREVGKVIVGVERADQLSELIPSARLPLSVSVIELILQLSLPGEALIDPRRWPDTPLSSRTTHAT